MVRRSYKRGPRLALPWEREDSPVRVLVSGRRLRPALFAVVFLVGLTGAYSFGGHHAELGAARAQLAEVERATFQFITEVGRCPHDPMELVHPPRTGVQYLHSAPVDPWGHPVFLRCSFDEHAQVEVLSAGPSGSLFNDDNIY